MSRNKNPLIIYYRNSTIPYRYRHIYDNILRLCVPYGTYGHRDHLITEYLFCLSGTVLEYRYRTGSGYRTIPHATRKIQEIHFHVHNPSKRTSVKKITSLVSVRSVLKLIIFNCCSFYHFVENIFLICFSESFPTCYFRYTYCYNIMNHFEILFYKLNLNHFLMIKIQ